MYKAAFFFNFLHYFFRTKEMTKIGDDELLADPKILEDQPEKSEKTSITTQNKTMSNSRLSRKRSLEKINNNETTIDSTDRKMLVLKTVKMHGCQFCGKEFNNKSNYNRHVRQMHLNRDSQFIF